MRYQWTDWITHVPGQVLLPGLYVICEQQSLKRNNGRPITQEGLITANMRGWPGWKRADPAKGWMLRRYKIRSIATEEPVARTRRKRVPA